MNKKPRYYNPYDNPEDDGENGDWLTLICRLPPILATLLDYLHFPDLKNLKRTNSEIYRQICDSGRIEKLGTLKLLHRYLSFDLGALQRLRHGCWHFKSLKVEMVEPVGEYNFLYESYEKCFRKRKAHFQYLCEHHLERLELTGNGKYFKILAEISLPGQEIIDAPPLAYKHLVHLEISDDTLNKMETEYFKSLTTHLRTLKIKIPEKEFKMGNQYLLDNMKCVAENCKTLKEYQYNWRSSIIPDAVRTQLLSAYAEGLLANKNAITNLALTYGQVIVDLQDNCFSNLKHVTVDLPWNEDIEEFLARQPFLESFEYKSRCNALQAVKFIFSRSSSLKKLELSGPNSNELRLSSRIQWEVLNELDSLKSFHFTADESNRFLAIKLFTNFPPSLTDIRLIGVCKQPHPYPNLTYYSTPSFINVTTLTLVKCRNILEDQDFQYICRTFTKLRILHFEHCPVTDFGLTGIPLNLTIKQHSAVSITNLRRLNELRINDCPNITNAVGSSILFEYLETLELRGNKNMDISDRFAKQIWEQNSRLQIFNYQTKASYSKAEPYFIASLYKSKQT